jgi:hypothetical protein
MSISHLRKFVRQTYLNETKEDITGQRIVSVIGSFRFFRRLLKYPR